MSIRWFVLPCALVAFMLASVRADPDWASMGYTPHSSYQSIAFSPPYFSNYSGGWPLRMKGVMLNDPEDWLDQTWDPNAVAGGVMGAEWEIYFQAVEPGDFGGTAVWMGQNYGSLGFVAPTVYYSEADWNGEMDRLNYAGGDPATAPRIRAGDLIEVRARGGLEFKGKHNLNEEHTIDDHPDTGTKFEIMLLQEDFGLPTPTDLALSDLKDGADEHLFDPTRASGPEHHQSTLVRLIDVTFDGSPTWAADSDVVVTDGLGRTFDVHLGLDESFNTAPVPTGPFNVTGIMDQYAPGFGHGTDNTAGYRLLVMDAGDFVSVPEPAALALLALGGLALIRRRQKA
jgi:MYXO-CTERM domain-containing protein